jgi:methylmalonyl-CoA mutase N-terminal domain/subunit
MPALIECARVYATPGETCGILRAVFGEHREPVAV